jgi:NAD(P)-dependent dehydrogenase (short-subunit alcohol dehydrogenase family)
MSATQTQSLFGCTAVVTGVSPGGIGVHTAIGLCKAGARVVLASRNRAKAEAAAGLIRSAVKPAAIVDVMQLDLASLASIRQCVSSHC